jgi:hypothetical protein
MSKILMSVSVLALLGGVASAQVTDVNIVNPSTDPGSVVEPRDSMPFIVYKQLTILPNDKGESIDVTALAPAGYRVIVDHISVIADCPPGMRLTSTGSVFPSANAGAGMFFAIPLTWQATNFYNNSAISELLAAHDPVQIPVETSQTLRLSLSKNKPDGYAHASFLVEGHYVRLQ